MNLHPASGIQAHEEQYEDMANAMGIDPATKKYVPFDIVHKKFAENFMKLVMHPLEDEGVDFWWLDWQQWSTTTIPGVNPTFYLNYVYFSDMERRRSTRPLIFHIVRLSTKLRYGIIQPRARLPRGGSSCAPLLNSWTMI